MEDRRQKQRQPRKAEAFMTPALPKPSLPCPSYTTRLTSGPHVCGCHTPIRSPPNYFPLMLGIDGGSTTTVTKGKMAVARRSLRATRTSAPRPTPTSLSTSTLNHIPLAISLPRMRSVKPDVCWCGSRAVETRSRMQSGPPEGAKPLIRRLQTSRRSNGISGVSLEGVAAAAPCSVQPMGGVPNMRRSETSETVGWPWCGSQRDVLRGASPRLTVGGWRWSDPWSSFSSTHGGVDRITESSSFQIPKR